MSDLYEDDELSKGTFRILNILEDLARRKAERVPNLRKVVCGEGMDNWDYYQWPSIMDNTLRGGQVKAAFALANIELSTWYSTHDPRVFDN